MSAELLASRRDATLILTLSNPGVKNALEPEQCAAAIEVLSTAERDDAVRAVVITGADAYFCAGSHYGRDHTAQSVGLDNLHGWIEAIQDCPKPVFAAVEGGATGAGFSLALACDLIICGSSAVFAMPNMQLGISAEGAAAWLLTRALPPQQAAEILFGGQSINAGRLHALGVVNRVVADGTALDSALEWADNLAQMAPQIIETMKSLLGAAAQQSLDQHFAEEKQAFIESLLHHK